MQFKKLNTEFSDFVKVIKPSFWWKSNKLNLKQKRVWENFKIDASLFSQKRNPIVQKKSSSKPPKDQN